MRCCQMVMGPAGTGKSTYCETIQKHCANSRRTVHIVNLDPAAEEFGYDVAFDIRDLITLKDVMEAEELGPNGGLVYCMEYLLDNMDWLKDELEQYDDDEYLIFDCPGQVELYSHIPVMRHVLDHLKSWGFAVCGVYLLDATFISDPAKFISGTLLSLSAMVQLELPHLNVLTKCDLADPVEVERFLDVESASLVALHSGTGMGVEVVPGNTNPTYGSTDDPSDLGDGAARHGNGDPRRGRAGLPRLARLTRAIASIVDDYSMVHYVPLDISDEDSIALVLQHADHIIQYGENLEPKAPYDEAPEDDSMASELYQSAAG